MISKDEAKAKLRKAGYSVVDDNSVITILVPEKTNIKNVVKNVKELFLKNDYQASFGVRQTNSALDTNDEMLEDETELEDSGIDTDEDIDSTVVALGEKTIKSKGSSKKKAKADSEDDFFDDEDENPENADSSITLDEFDMDMLLNEESVQFSLEDFGMM